MVIITLHGKHMWHPANRRNDGPRGYFGFAVNRKDGDKLVKNSTVVVWTVFNVTQNISFGSN